MLSFLGLDAGNELYLFPLSCLVRVKREQSTRFLPFSALPGGHLAEERRAVVPSYHQFRVSAIPVHAYTDSPMQTYETLVSICREGALLTLPCK